MNRIAPLAILLTTAGLILLGCQLVFAPPPEPQGVAARLDAFPTRQLPLSDTAVIYWDDHQIPFIHAASDADVPFLIGLVHAHLRLAQMELLRRASQGRLAEMFGPFVTDVDHALRILDFGKAVPQIRNALPGSSRRWLRRYTEGVNRYVRDAGALSPEIAALGIRPEPWTVDDILTLGRLTATDVNWLYWFFNVRIRNEPAWPEIWQRLTAHGRTSIPSYGAVDGEPLNLIGSTVKSGSNSYVIAGSRSATGSGLIANDPHLGLMLPNLWLILGVRSPGYQMVGLSLPGIPAVLVGRNRHIAWGGTNMLSLSSTLYDISAQPSPDFRERRETVRVRWWFDKTVTIRDSGLGPVISDAEPIEKWAVPTLALKWRGHMPSDEFTAFLKVNRAESWSDFRAAFATYAVSGQNMLYADTAGNIGQLMAVEFAPAAARAGAAFFGDPDNPVHRWTAALGSTDLPAVTNPARGYLVSTNNIPVRSRPPVSLLGNSNDRYRTIAGRLDATPVVSVADLKRLQTDVFSRKSLDLAQAVAANAPKGNADATRLVEALRRWDGRYTMDSKGAAALELTAYHLASDYYTMRYGDAIMRYLLRSPAVYAFLRQDLDRDDMASVLPGALEKAAHDFRSHSEWRGLHRLHLRHPLGNAPLIGGRYRFGDYPVPGSTNTVMKSAHPLSNRPHRVTYGANSRHISDLSDMDANWFALLGGQDGFLGSDNFLDLFELWQRSEYVQVPLRLETVRRAFTHRLVLTPEG